MYSFDTLERIYIALGITPGSIEQVGYIEPKPGDPNAPVVEIVP
jgi:hypothetical protein